MPKICHVVGAGDFSESLLHLAPSDFLIAADAGYEHLAKANIRPHLYIGDGDSLGYNPEGIQAVVLPPVKDDTDIHAALREGLIRGYRHFRIYGALGGKRFSHSLANLQVLAFLAENNAEGILIDEHYLVYYLTRGIHTFNFTDGYFSLFDFSGTGIISVTGAKYPLEQATLPPSLTLGISNEGTKRTVIQIHEGAFYLIREP